MWKLLLYVVSILAVKVTSMESSVFTTSSASFSPNFLGALANVTVSFSSSVAITSGSSDMYAVHVFFPVGYEPSGTVPSLVNCTSLFLKFGALLIDECSQLPTLSLILSVDRMTFAGDSSDLPGGIISPLVYFDFETRSVIIRVLSLSSLQAVSIRFCCLALPITYSDDALSFSLVQYSSGGALSTVIPKKTMVSRILTSTIWTILTLQFDPPTANAFSQLIFTFASSDTLLAGTVVAVVLPGFECLATVVTYTSDGPLSYVGQWAQNIFTFSLESDILSGITTQITTSADLFKLPPVSAINSNLLLVSASLNGEEIVSETAIYQSEEILPEIEFLYSSLVLDDGVVWFTFAVNRALYTGTALFIRLPGYQANVGELSILGDWASFFDHATFDPPTSTISLQLVANMYFNGTGLDTKMVGFPNIEAPLGQYENDESLLVKVGSNSKFSKIQFSEAFGVDKKFTLSTIAWDSPFPNTETGFTVSFRSSVALFAGTRIVVNLRGDFVRLMPSLDIPLPTIDGVDGGDCGESFLLNKSAQYSDYLGNLLIFAIAPESVLPANQTCTVYIDVAARIRLPAKLTLNDGSLKIEANSHVVINSAPVAVSGPPVGEPKGFISGATSIVFDPIVLEQPAVIHLTMSFNTDLLIGSELCLHLGGFARIGGEVILLGASQGRHFGENAIWDDFGQNLTMTITPLQSEVNPDVSFGIRAGQTIWLKIGHNQNLILPQTLYPADPSIHVTVFDSGIATPQYFSTQTDMNPIVLKEFESSEISYETNSVSVELKATFALRSNSYINIRLFGFTLVETRPGTVTLDNVVGLVSDEIIFEQDLTSFTPKSIGKWDGEVFSLKIIGKEIESFTRFKIVIPVSFFPDTTLVNDPNLQVSVNGSQILFWRQIKKSPAIIPNIFADSSIQFHPNVPLETAQVAVLLVPSVSLPNAANIGIYLYRFTIPEGSLIVNVTVQNIAVRAECVWNATTEYLNITLYTPVSSLDEISVIIPESESIMLPEFLNLNDETLTVTVMDHLLSYVVIPETAFLKSPLLGDGPFSDQFFCAYMLETGIRGKLGFRDCSLCLLATNNPCSKRILERCGCPPLADSPKDMFVGGFNLRESDSIFFVNGANCKGAIPSNFVQVGNNSIGQLGEYFDGISYSGIRPLKPGILSICIVHLGLPKFAGQLHVRPNCLLGQVLMENSCQETCPFGYLPINGQCVLSSFKKLSKSPTFTIQFVYPNAINLEISNLPATDSTYIFFEFVFTSNLAQVLYEDEPSRFRIVKVTDNKFVADGLFVTVVFTPSTETSIRSPEELRAVLLALISDPDSTLYLNEFFSTVVSPDSKNTLNFASMSLSVQSETFYCPETQTYNTVCPLVLDPMPSDPTYLPLWYTISLIAGGIVGGFAFAGILLGMYRADTSSLLFKRKNQSNSLIDQDNNFSIIKINDDTNDNGKLPVISALDPSARVEYAKSWLDGKLLDESLLVRSRRRIEPENAPVDAPQDLTSPTDKLKRN